MTPIDLTFPHEELSPLSTEDAPNAKTLLTLKKDVYANARAIESAQGGGAHGHLGLVMDPAAYLALVGGAVACADPFNPGVINLNGASTGAAIVART